MRQLDFLVTGLSVVRIATSDIGIWRGCLAVEESRRRSPNCGAKCLRYYFSTCIHIKSEVTYLLLVLLLFTLHV